MHPEHIISELKETNQLAESTLMKIETNKSLRQALVNYFSMYDDRDFALRFLEYLTELRIEGGFGISGDSLMLASYILGQHGQVEDCLKVWEAKGADFDAFCYIDIQLVPFMGVEKTMAFLKSDTSLEAAKLLEYLESCQEAGDLDHLDEYYGEYPWFI